MIYKIVLSILFSITTQAMDLNQEFIDAVKDGAIERVQELINAGANVNAQDYYGNTALMWLAYRGNKYRVEFLLNYGADVTLKNHYDYTALDLAKVGFNTYKLSKEKYKEIGRILLEAYIEQLKEAGMKNAESRAILESKKAEVQKLVAQYPGIPAQEIIKHLKL